MLYLMCMVILGFKQIVEELNNQQQINDSKQKTHLPVIVLFMVMAEKILLLIKVFLALRKKRLFLLNSRKAMQMKKIAIVMKVKLLLV